MENELQQAIRFSLDYSLYHNAIFLAEKLYAQFANEQNLYLLATSYYKSGKPNKAHFILRNAISHENVYLFSVCCYDLGKWKEAEMSIIPMLNLDGDQQQFSHKIAPPSPPQEIIPPSYYLLGLIYTYVHSSFFEVSNYHSLVSGIIGFCLFGFQLITINVLCFIKLYAHACV